MLSHDVTGHADPTLRGGLYAQQQLTNTKPAQRYSPGFACVDFCLISFWACSSLTGPLLVYYSFQFCVFMGFVFVCVCLFLFLLLVFV